MKEPKYSTDTILYPRGCSKEYQIKHQSKYKMIELIKERIDSTFPEDNEAYYDIEYYAYSNNGSSWFPEETLTDTLGE